MEFRSYFAGHHGNSSFDNGYSGGDEHDKERFESLCAELKSKNANFSVDVADFWKKTQDCVAKGLENAEWLSKIQEFAETLQPELGL